MMQTEKKTIEERIAGNVYPGRGIVVGKTPDGKRALAAYFIMGRSANSRNRVFVKKDGALFTQPYDASKVEDPRLIIYAAARTVDNKFILTNGDQTDTAAEGIKRGESFSQALSTREFEPDAPNFTPRISAMLTFADKDFTYEMSILKSVDGKGGPCARYTFAYPAVAGLGHFLHTYVENGDPLPAFRGEPEQIALPDGLDEAATRLWDALDENNRISLYVCSVDLATGEREERIINRNK